MSRFRKMSNAEISLWKKSKNKMLALKAMRDEQEENPDAPDGIPYYEVGTPIVRHQDYVEPIYLNPECGKAHLKVLVVSLRNPRRHQKTVTHDKM